jgi:hypothetical protein
MSAYTLRVSEGIWYDALDPRATDMQSGLELPEPRRSGRSMLYDDVSRDVALDLASYLADRGDLLLANSDPEFDKRERDLYRRMITTAERIRALVA